MTVDRQSRDKLVDAIERYLAEKISAFEFDVEIFRTLDESPDPTVKTVVLSLWTLYDDCKDHKVVLSKEAWDYCQRLVLILKSDAHIETTTCKLWSITQLVAGLALLAFAGCAFRLGIGIHLFALAVPFGLVSMALSQLRNSSRQRRVPTDEIALLPFSGVSEVLALRRRFPSFSKRKFPRHITGRRIRSPSEGLAIQLQWRAVWLLMSPIALFVQILPDTDLQTRVTGR